MIVTNKYLFLGGDKRQQYAAQALTDSGNSVRFAESSPDLERLIALADSIVLPLPVSRDNVFINSPLSVAPVRLDRVVSAVSEGQKVFAGMASRELIATFKRKGIQLYDYYKDESLIISNAVSTAEGVIFEAIGATEIDLCGSKTALTGYGKTASALAWRLRALGAEVTVAARSTRDRACAKSDGCKAISLDEISIYANTFDLIVNTVPAQIIGENALKTLKKSCVIIEIASAPFGIDFEAAERLGIKTIKAMSLPGKISPKSAGTAIAQTIIELGRLGDK